MADKIEYSRLITKRSSIPGTVPTIPTGTTLDTLVSTDLFIGEIFLNQADDLMWVRTENGILPIAISGGSAFDVYVTGGTYSNSTGTATFTNNSGNTFNVTGFFTGSTAPFDVFVTGGTHTAGTTTFRNNTGGTFTVSGYTTGSTTPSLSAVLAVGNTTGINNISVNTNQSIVSPGLGQLDFYGSEIILTNDGGALGDSYLDMYSGAIDLATSGSSLNLSNLDGSYFYQNQLGTLDSTITLNYDPTYDGLSEYQLGLTVRSNVGGASANGCGIFIGNTSFSNQTKSNLLGTGLVGVIINSIDSLIKTGITNSVIIGGTQITATTNDTVYTSKLNIKSIGSGTSITNLGIDSLGNVVTGTSASAVSALKTKSGVVAFSSFTGSPYSYNVVFGTAFSDALYSPSIVGVDSRAWSVSNISSTGFRIETNSSTILTSSVYWTAIKHGEN